MTKIVVLKNEYHDSVLLMNVSEAIRGIEGIEQVVVVMGTDMNKTVLADVGMLTVEANEATANDLVIAIQAENESAVEKALTGLRHLLSEKAAKVEGEVRYASVEAAIKGLPHANLVFISVPGEFAAAEAKKAIMSGLHTFIFSDNVPLSEEVELKRLAREKGLLVMGPACGAALINGVALGLMSKVRPGPIGIVGASGSGIQEVAVLVHKQGLGISQAIGTGSRDLCEDVGAVTMLQGIEFLENDKNTEVIVLVSKPPALKTMNLVLQRVARCKKPVITDFLGGDREIIRKSGALPASTFEEAASKAVNLARKQALPEDTATALHESLRSLADGEKARLASQQKYLRGLFCGGAHCEEAILLLQRFVRGIYSNVPLDSCVHLDTAKRSHKNSIIDMGDEEFTKGRPHPVIDPSALKERLWKEGSDPEVAVILLDIILGYGAHPDPAGVLAETIVSLKEGARRAGRYLSIVASVCGTDEDPQCLATQEAKLKEVGVIVMPSNAQASILSGLIIS